MLRSMNVTYRTSCRGTANPMNAQVANDPWLQANSSVATLGVVAVDLPRGIWISEWSDADFYEMEPVEISIL